MVEEESGGNGKVKIAVVETRLAELESRFKEHMREWTARELMTARIDENLKSILEKTEELKVDWNKLSERVGWLEGWKSGMNGTIKANKENEHRGEWSINMKLVGAMAVMAGIQIVIAIVFHA